MAYNLIQFQSGMSIPEFLSCFGTEAQCAQAVKAGRWPQGFACARCASPDHYVVGHGARKLFQCKQCRHQTSLTSGSLMEHTKLPLTTWFLAIFLISQAKTGLSALALKRHLGVSYPTAWKLHHKINSALAEQDSTQRLGGTVQLDDAYLGGQRNGARAGRGSPNKVPFLAGVSLNAQGHPMHLKLSRVRGFSLESVEAWAKSCLSPGSVVYSDGLSCFPAVAAAGCQHVPIVVGERLPRDLPQFTWVNTVLGNLKTTLAGAFHSLKYRKYADRYLGAFAYRFNRRFDLHGLVAQAITDVVRATPAPESALRAHAEPRY